jgi:hypothetical protein
MIVAISIPPIVPSQVLLGEIFGVILCLPIDDPMKYPNVSTDIVINIGYNIAATDIFKFKYIIQNAHSVYKTISIT